MRVARLIEGQRWEELLERAFSTFHEIHGSELSMMSGDERLIREFLAISMRNFGNFRRLEGQPLHHVRHSRASTEDKTR